MTRPALPRRRLQNVVQRTRVPGLEPLEDRRLLAMLGATFWDYDAPAPAWFAANAPSESLEIQPARPATEWIVRLGEECLSPASKPSDVAPLLGTFPDVAFRVLQGLGLPGQILVSSTSNPAAIETALRGNPSVASFSANSVVTAATAPNDELFKDLVGLDNTGQLLDRHEGDPPPDPSTVPDIDALAAWEIQKGSPNVVVAVLDSGIDVQHEDLLNNLWTNEIEAQFPDNDVDDDGNGCVDDVHGCNFTVLIQVRGQNTPETKDDEYLPTGDVTDFSGHGTHVAGTIGAQGNNRIGVTGVAQDVSLMSLKVLGADNTGKTSDVILAVNWAKDMAAKMRSSPEEPQLRVINASLGSYSRDRELENAIRAADENGILFVAAAGNGVDGISGVDTDATPFYPAAYNLDNIISVAAVDNFDVRLRFSNFGRNSVDIAAPGSGVLSTLPDDEYGISNGTSMAAPLVSGVAALLWSQYSFATVEEVRDAILRSGDSLPGLQDKTVSGKRLNAAKALLTDTARPHVELIGTPRVNDARDPALISVLVRDNHSLDPSLWADSTLQVRRRGTAQISTAEVYEISQNDEKAMSFTVTYLLQPFGGDNAWGEEDNGLHDITLPPNSIFDRSGNSAVGQVLDQLRVTVDELDVLRVDDIRDKHTPAGALSLRAAIRQANSQSGPNRVIKIVLPNLSSLVSATSIYQLDIEQQGEDGAVSGDLDITGNITIVGEGFNNSIIDGGELDRVFDVHPGATLRLSGVTVRKGAAPLTSDTEGGGIRNQGTLELYDVVLRANKADRGAGLYNAPGGRATVRATSFVANEARGVHDRTKSLGGGVYNASNAGAELPELETLAALGGEQLINAADPTPQRLPSVAVDTVGNSLVLWESFDGSSVGRIYAQRFDKTGAKLGGQIPVSTIGRERVHPSVAIGPDGTATIVWQGYDADGDGWGIQSRKLDKNGNWLTASEGRVYGDEYAPGHQTEPHVTIGARGDELIVWNSNDTQNGSSVYARFQPLDGVSALTLRANVGIGGIQSGATGAVADDGRALIVWSTERSDGSQAVVARRLNHLGIPLGGELVLASSTDVALLANSVIATPDGYVVSWTESSPEGDAARVLYRRLDRLGTPLSEALPLSDSAATRERGAVLARLPDGGFAAAFASLSQDNSGWNVLARQFDADGVPRSGAFPVNTTRSGSQANPRLAANATGLITIAWDGEGAGDLSGVSLQRFEAAFNEASVLDAATLRLENVTFSGNRANDNGGAVYSATGALTTLVHSTVHRNIVNQTTGGAVVGETDGTLALKSSIVAANLLKVPGWSDLEGRITSLGYNLISIKNERSGYGRGSDLIQDNAGAFLEALPAENVPQVHQLLPGSLAIDHGDAARATSVDQVGSPRPQDGDGDDVSAPDIGAVERYYGEIHGKRYHDKNANGRQDADELPNPGLVVYLDTNHNGLQDDGEPTAITSEEGDYEFKNVKPGEHFVAIAAQEGWERTTPPQQTPADQPKLALGRLTIDHLTIDVNNDQMLDLVALERNTQTNEDVVLVYMNDGDGNFEPISSAPYFLTGVSTASGIAAGDIDGDHWIDLVITHGMSSGPITWLQNLRGSGFAAPQNAVDNADSPHAPILALLNDDPYPDLAWLDATRKIVSIALNDGHGVFLPASMSPLLFSAENLTVGDVDGDRVSDLIVGSQWLPFDVALGTFGEARPISSQDTSAIQVAVDLDRDGDLDFLGLRASRQKLYVLRKEPGLAVRVEEPIELGGTPQALQLGDFNRDGYQDVAVLLSDPGKIQFLTNDNGKLRLAVDALSFDAGDQPVAFRASDLDGDGYPEVSVTVVTGAESRLALFRNSRGANRVNLFAGQLKGEVDFGEQALAAEISGFVFNDLDRDGYFDVGAEGPMPADQNVKVLLYHNGNQVAFADVNRVTGRYAFPNVTPLLNYTVLLTSQSGWTQTVPKDGNDDTNDGYTIEKLPADGAVTGLNFGRYDIRNIATGQDGHFQGFVVRDVNASGVNDEGDVPLSKVTVYIDTNKSGGWDEDDAVTVTNDDGYYEFHGISGGEYVVRLWEQSDMMTADPAGNAFSPSKTDVGKAPQGVALIDFDGDGDLDIATPNIESNDVTILQNNNGVMETLPASLKFGTGAASPSSIVVAQLDGDGHWDIAVTNLDTRNITVYLSDWSGDSYRWFRFGGNYSAGPRPTAITAGDWDQDGYIDLAVVNETGENGLGAGSLVLLKNDRHGAFSPMQSPLVVNYAPRAVTSADFDGDGRLDLAVATFESPNVLVFWNSGGQFSPGAVTTVATGQGPASLAVAELDEVVGPDLIVGNYYSSSVTVHYYGGSRQFAATDGYTLPLSPTSLAVADVDGDGDDDIAAGTRSKDGEALDFSLLRNRRNQRQPFAPAEKISLGTETFPYSLFLSVAAGELNGDGRVDLVVTDGKNNTARVLLNGEAWGAHRVALTGERGEVLPDFNFVLRSIYNPPTIDFIAGQTVNEDDPNVTEIPLSGITAGKNEPGQPLSIDVSSSDASFFEVLTASLEAPNGTLAFRVAPNRFGTQTVTVTITDGGPDQDLSTRADNGVASTTFDVHVVAADDPPVPALPHGALVEIVEDAGPQSLPWATVTDLDVQPGLPPGPIAYLVETVDPTLFKVAPSIAPDGTLTFTPDDNAFGTTEVRVRARDAVGAQATSAALTFTIHIESVNDAPSFSLKGDVVAEEDRASTWNVPGQAFSISPGPLESSQTVSFATRIEGPADLFVSGQEPAIDASGKLTFRARQNAFGSVRVFVRALDNADGQNASAEQSFSLTVSPVNDPPTLTPGPDVFVLVNSGEYSSPWATNISNGPNEPTAPRPTFSIFVASGQSLFAPATDTKPSGQPRVLDDGTLTFRLQDGEWGRAEVFVFILDGQLNSLYTLHIAAFVSGDTDNNGRVDLEDLNAVRNHFGKSAPEIAGDTFPFDGVVDLEDLNAVRNNFGATVSSPATSTPRPLATDAVFHAWNDADAHPALMPSKRTWRRLLGN